MRIFLACTPRSGNVWFRRLLGALLDTPLFIGHNPGQIAWNTLPADCIVAMHWHYNSWFAAFLEHFEFQPVCLLRHPLDVLISILRFAPAEPATARWLEGECGDERTLIGASPADPAFANYCLSARAATLLHVSPGWAHDCRALVRYEDLAQNPPQELERFLAGLGVTPKASIDDVVAAESIDNLRPLAPHHFWQGRSGLWRELFSTDLARAVHRRLPLAFEAGGYEYEQAGKTTPSHDEIAKGWERLAAR